MTKSTSQFLLLFLFLLFSGCQGWQEDPAFQKLLGAWETNASIYRNCTVKITPDKLVFSRHPDYEEHFAIKDMETSLSEKSLLVTLYLKGPEGTELKQRFFLIEKKDRFLMRTLPPESCDWTKRKEVSS